MSALWTERSYQFCFFGEGKYSTDAIGTHGFINQLIDWAYFEKCLVDMIPEPEDFDLAKFTKSVFYMFGGEPVQVDLRCDNSLMKTLW